MITSSMSNEIEYLVKYSVAPSPSRDYYGLKILQDEVILYLWKISHGPHKAPIIYRAKFIEFDQEKLLQSEIRHGFGEHLLKYVKNIAEGNRNTLLTLPKVLIGKLSEYLKFTDIIKLSSLSRIAYEIFNADSVWQILYKRDKKAKISAEEREKAKVYSWKQLYKDRQMQMSIKDRKNQVIKQSSIKYASDTKINKPSLRPINDESKPVSKTASAIAVAKNNSEFFSRDFVTIPLSKAMSDTRCLTANTEKKKALPLKRNVKNTDFKTRSVNEKNIKKKEVAAPKITTKRETGNVSKYGEGEREKSEKYINKTNSTNRTSQEESVAVTMPFSSKSAIKNVKSSSRLVQNSHNNTRSKTKIKAKKITTTKSELFNTNKALSDNPFVVKDNFDLADLIEASLKNIRSPRSIFDYDFSCMQQTTDVSKAENETQNIDKFKQLKSTQNNVIADYFSKRINQGDRALERLSEKSELHSETSTESLVKNKKLLRRENNRSSKKYMKEQMEVRRSLDWRRNDPFSEAGRDSCSRTNIQSKYLSPKKVGNIDKRLPIAPIAREPLKSSSLLKAHASNSLKSRMSIPEKNFKVASKHRIGSTKIVKNIEEVD